MNYRDYWKRAAPLALVILLLPRVSLCQSPREQMQKEISRISRAIQAKPDSDKDWKEAKSGIINSLESARESLAAGRLFVALENLADAWVNLVAAESMLGKQEAVKQGLPGFEAEWGKADTNLKLWERRYEEGQKNSVPLAVRAIAETNSVESRRYYYTSRAFANASSQPTAADAEAGLNILGAAKGSIEFAVFCESLHFKHILSEPPLRSLEPEIHQLEESMIAAYQPPRSIDKHAEFIRMHSALKEAGDLEAARLYAGAFYKYLDALQMFEALNVASSSNAPTLEELQKKVQQKRENFDSDMDSSLVELFLERTKSSEIASADAGGPSRSQIQQAVLTKVIPEYYEILEKQEVQTQTTAKTITVTLVRWPYT
jgi:hypothetical protein